jgi:hypothetical protein
MKVKQGSAWRGKAWLGQALQGRVMCYTGFVLMLGCSTFPQDLVVNCPADGLTVSGQGSVTYGVGVSNNWSVTCKGSGSIRQTPVSQPMPPKLP